jgi:hypothetical protein
MKNHKNYTLAPLELPGKLIIKVLFLIPATGLDSIAIGVTFKDLDSMTITRPKIEK